MGISRLTLSYIQDSEPENIKIVTGQVEKDGKFGADLMIRDHHGSLRRFLSTECKYDSDEDAKAAMEEIVQQCRDAEPAFGGGS